MRSRRRQCNYLTASEQSGEATSQIATTIQQIALGTGQQTASVTRTAGSVEQMAALSTASPSGAQEQSNSVGKASTVASHITTAIQQVADNAQADDPVRRRHRRHPRVAPRPSKRPSRACRPSRPRSGSLPQRCRRWAPLRPDRRHRRDHRRHRLPNQPAGPQRRHRSRPRRRARQGLRRRRRRSSQAGRTLQLSATKEIAGLIKGIQKTVNA